MYNDIYIYTYFHILLYIYIFVHVSFYIYIYFHISNINYNNNYDIKILPIEYNAHIHMHKPTPKQVSSANCIPIADSYQISDVTNPKATTKVDACMCSTSKYNSYCITLTPTTHTLTHQR